MFSASQADSKALRKSTEIVARRQAIDLESLASSDPTPPFPGTVVAPSYLIRLVKKTAPTAELQLAGDD